MSAAEVSKLVEEATASLQADKASDAVATAKKALETAQGDGVAAGEALAVLLKAQLSIPEATTLDGALAVIKDETSKLSKVGAKKGEAAMLLATAEVYMAVGDADKALRVGLDAQTIFAKEGESLKEAQTLYKVIAPAHIDASNIEKASAAAQSALKLAQQEGSKRDEACARYAIAAALYENGAVDEALEAATKALSVAKDLGDKFKESEVSCLVSQCYYGMEDGQAALSAAKDALSAAKDVPSGPQAAAAVSMIVEATVLAGTPQEGLDDAERELAALEGSGKTAGVADMMGAVVLAVSATQHPNAGFDRVKEYVEKCRAAGNKKGEVEMLRRMATLSEYPDVAMNTAQAAMKLAQKIGDVAAEARLKPVLTDLWVAKGKLDKAPTRKQALALLNELARDLEKKDAEKFEDTNKKLNKYMNALTETDFQATIYKVVAKDTAGYMSFLKDHGMVAEDGPKKKEGPITGHKFKPIPVPELYMGFRWGGLGYGPRYRVNQPACKIMHEGGGAIAVIDLQDCSDDWERELGYSPSLLDGALQSGAAMGH
mmetsp:Transcript_95993/g.271421  ORF Transcript_95993/g.271421 Transcript_95993/m.271421 type:complete len:546 (-) Transcript_95993:108-1745(-)